MPEPKFSGAIFSSVGGGNFGVSLSERERSPLFVEAKVEPLMMMVMVTPPPPLIQFRMMTGHFDHLYAAEKTSAYHQKAPLAVAAPASA